MRLGRDPSTGSPNPAASRADDSPRGSSSSARGFPRVSVSSRASTCSSTRAAMTDASSFRAEASGNPARRSSGSPVSSSTPPGSRSANRRTTDSAARRRATNASTCAEDRSSHWTSSTTQTSGRSSAALESKLSTASPTRNRSGCAPESRPNAVASASRCGVGNPARPSSRPAQSWCRPAKGSSISHCTPVARRTRQPSARSAAYSRRADLPMPGSPRRTSTTLRPSLASASS
jgi:hypothetical protein